MDNKTATGANTPVKPQKVCSKCEMVIPAEVTFCPHCGMHIASSKPISKWHIHRRMYNWVLSFAHSKHSMTALFTLSFAESSFFPIPPDVLLMPLCLGHRKKSLWFALVTTVASVMGAYFGYILGMWAVDAAVAVIPFITHDQVQALMKEFEERGQWYVFVAALTPIPFKLLTITAGAANMNLLVFTLACVVGRSIRFFGVAGMFWWIGPKAGPFIDKYFNWLAMAFAVLLVGGFVVAKYCMH